MTKENIDKANKLLREIEVLESNIYDWRQRGVRVKGFKGAITLELTEANVIINAYQAKLDALKDELDKM